jgi:hypothetical protein
LYLKTPSSGKELTLKQNKQVVNMQASSGSQIQAFTICEPILIKARHSAA